MYEIFKAKIKIKVKKVKVDKIQKENTRDKIVESLERQLFTSDFTSLKRKIAKVSNLKTKQEKKLKLKSLMNSLKKSEECEYKKLLSK